MYRVVPNARLPKNLEEQDIIVVDLVEPERIDTVAPTLSHYKGGGEEVIVDGTKTRILNPRIPVMHAVRKSFDRVLAKGGVFIVFVDLKQEFEYRNVRMTASGYDEIGYVTKYDSWTFLSVLGAYQITSEGFSGTAATLNDGFTSLNKILRKRLEQVIITAKFSFNDKARSEGHHWSSVLENIFNESVGAWYSSRFHKGRVLLLPQFQDKNNVLLDLFKYFLPKVSPHLFESSSNLWFLSKSYEHPEVLNLQNEIKAIEDDAQKQIKHLNTQIDECRTQLQFIHDLITETDDKLVMAVRRILEEFGFDHVQPMDNENDSRNLQEDLQIHGTPLLLVEVKGINGFPIEDDTNQINKYIVRRMKELGRTDVKGVVVVNSQRHTPLFERRIETAFTKEQVEDAQNQGVLLVSTSDLYILYRAAQKNRWQTRSMKTLFEDTGRMSRIPPHYERIGIVEQTAPKQNVVGFTVEIEELRPFDRIGFLSDFDYIEQEVQSIEIDGKSVEKAVKGDLPGVRLVQCPRVKTILYRVN